MDLGWGMQADAGMVVFSRGPGVCGFLGFRVVAGQRLDLVILTCATVWWTWPLGGSGRGVEACHESAVGGACGGEFFVAFVELDPKIDRMLLEGGDAGVELIDVVGRAEARAIVLPNCKNRLRFPHRRGHRHARPPDESSGLVQARIVGVIMAGDRPASMSSPNVSEFPHPTEFV